ncbi:phosphatidate cytidylyltransferase [Spiroplasma sp. DGKH1]|uniref:phosphatidate cytidylyltransferase n=1 Tax=Spiroplasma sp. DGKH1 TaxID=3050074 RepID=UPI0034C6BC09
MNNIKPKTPDNTQPPASDNQPPVENNTPAPNQKHVMFQKKYRQRYITFGVLLCFLVLYMFTGAITTEWQTMAHIDVANYVFIILNCLILCLVNYEILKLNGGDKWPIYTQVITYLLIVFLYILPVERVSEGYAPINFPFYTYANWGWLQNWLIFVIYFFVFLVYMVLILSGKDITFGKMFITFAFSIYMIFAFKAMTKFMLNPNFGWSSVLWLALIIILTDTFAFVGGVSYGKHKLAPNVSPNKTWEGAITGTLVASAIAIAYAILMFKFTDQADGKWVFDFFSNDNSQNTMRYIIYVLLAIILSILSQLGDLSFSWIKRKYNIKDFSNLLPGHGGVLDRLDSFSLVFVVMFIISAILMK